jgi:hypothetical protein
MGISKIANWTMDSLRGSGNRAVELPAEGPGKGATGEPPPIHLHSSGIRYMQLAGIAHAWGYGTNDIRAQLNDEGNRGYFEIIDQVHGPIVLVLWDHLSTPERNDYTECVLGFHRKAKLERGKGCGHSTSAFTGPECRRAGAVDGPGPGLRNFPPSPAEPCAEPLSWEPASPPRTQGECRGQAAQSSKGPETSGWQQDNHPEQGYDETDPAGEPPTNASYNPWFYLTNWNQNDSTAWDY